MITQNILSAFSIVIAVSNTLAIPQAAAPATLGDCLKAALPSVFASGTADYSVFMKGNNNGNGFNSKVIPKFFVQPESNGQVIIADLIHDRRSLFLNNSEPILFGFQVAAVVKCSNFFNTPISARSGGHSYEAYSLSPGITMDMGKMNSITFDDKTLVVDFGGGNWLGRVYRFLENKGGYAIPGGDCPAVGLGGHALGGGYGFLSRKYGLVTDNIVEMTMVDAQGNVLTVNKSNNPELFWALRGAGGGNFGIVTHFKIKVVKIEGVSRMWVKLDPAKRKAIIDTYIKLAPTVSNDFTMALVYSKGQFGLEVVTPLNTADFSGTDFDKKLLSKLTGVIGTFPSPFKSWAQYTMKNINTDKILTDRSDVRTVERYKSTSVMVNGALSSEGIDALLKGIDDSPSGVSTYVIMDTFGGQISAVPVSETSFIHRGSNLVGMQISSNWQSDSTDAVGNAHTKKWRESLLPFVSKEAYQNYIDSEVPLEFYYGVDGLAKLKNIKKKYDPQNKFNFKQSIPMN
ncbi:hypothetical protein HDU97_007885 [Phlyctochytrium planicorne]|nr:hypothetical protein HDU97_007885 [Phlyctochytrium planicorne]